MMPREQVLAQESIDYPLPTLSCAASAYTHTRPLRYPPNELPRPVHKRLRRVDGLRCPPRRVDAVARLAVITGITPSFPLPVRQLCAGSARMRGIPTPRSVVDSAGRPRELGCRTQLHRLDGKRRAPPHCCPPEGRHPSRRRQGDLEHAGLAPSERQLLCRKARLVARSLVAFHFCFEGNSESFT